ncbi:MAG: DsbA family protein [bacterium]|nr:DsbA family protein [bacterium]
MEDSQKPGKDLLLPGSILVAAFLIAGALIYSVGARNLAPQPANLVATVSDKDLADDDVVLGSVDAPVTLVEFGDYQCPFCGRFFSQVEPKIREEYIKTGKVKMIYRDFAFLGPESVEASMASQCAAEQKKFWEYHDGLYAAEVSDGREHNGNLSEIFFKSLASSLGLDRTRFDSCLSSKKYFKEVEKDYADGLAAGVTGTPTTFVNGKALSGAVPYEQIKVAIDEALTATR